MKVTQFLFKKFIIWQFNFMDIINIILEIVKFTLPSVIVFMTAYYLMKNYLDHQTNMKAMDIKSRAESTLVSVKLQAYERLILFLERIMPYNLYLRLKSNELNAKALQQAMILAIQQEYEHNMTQQLYVSKSLWRIIQMAKEQTVEIISKCGDNVNNTEDATALMDKISLVMAELKTNPIDHAKMAIKKEMELVI